MGKWDSFAKLLIGTRPWQFVCWLMAGAELVEVLSVELNAQAFLADALLKIRIHGQLALLHIEFQCYEDPTMGSRMLKYNVLAEHQYGLPVSSFVVYLRKRKMPKTPFVRKFVDGHITYHFHFRIVKLWDIPAQTILNLGWEGLLPLLPLTKGGKKPEIVQVMIDQLVASHDKDLLALTEMYGGLAFTSEAEKVRFKRRFIMFQDIMKDSWVYQEIVQESEERGKAQGEAKGVQSQRQAILDIVDKRFPHLHALALQQVSQLNNLDTLRILIVEISIRDSEQDVRTLLTETTNT